MTYAQIRKILIDNDLECSISLDIASCVSACVKGEQVNDELFTDLCRYVRRIWDDIEKPNTQQIADVVCDAVLHLYEYHNNIELTREELRNGERTEEIVKVYFERIDY